MSATDELERAQHEDTLPSGDVTADDFTRGTNDPVGKSAFSDQVVDALKAALAPDRVRRRKGRGRGQFEYIAGHDAKRRMNEIFGFGGWSANVVSNVEIAAVEVEKTNDKGETNGQRGWHVGYHAHCVVKVRTLEGDWVEYGDDGYGDGVEYGAAARVTACELALKEAATDAFKRAATYLGDQFGLILYAKDDEQKRIARDNNAQDARTVVRDIETSPPRGPELLASWKKLLGDSDEAEAQRQWWMDEAVEVHFGKPKTELTRPQREIARQKFTTTYLELVDGAEVERDPFGIPTRAAIIRALGIGFGGVKVEGPPWAIAGDPVDGGRPSHAEWRDALAAAPVPGSDDDIPFG